jgi:glutamine synthetase
MKLEQIQKLAKDKGAEFLDLKFCDLVGSWHHVTLPISSLEEKLFKSGVGVDGSSLSGFASIKRGDMIMIPDPATAFIDPFFDRPTVSLLGNIWDVDETAEPFDRDPRRVAAAAERYVGRVVKGAVPIFGPEFEYYLFDSVSYDQQPQTAYYQVVSEEGGWVDPAQADLLGYKIAYKKGYHAAPPYDRTYNLRNQIASLLADVGVGVKYHHHEVGAAGQYEFEVKFAPLLKMADQSMLVKYIIRNECFRNGKTVTFMPKPLDNEPGSGLHLHHYLTSAAGSLFYDKNGVHRFSKEGMYYMGGLLKHVDSILAFTNPSTNSYKRLVPGFEAPVAGTYSVGNRTACIRIPGYQKDPKTMRFEFRPPDATMNPYLAYAALVMAGVDGIKNKIDPGLALDKNLDQLSAVELKKLHQLPTSLDAALTALERDNKYLLDAGVFSEDLLENWLVLKRRDIDKLRRQPTPGEYELYYGC